MIPQAFKSVDLTTEEVLAIRALSGGEASAYEQRLAFVTIIKKLARAYDQPFVPGHQDQTNFLCGRAFVGQELLKVSKISPITNES
jgi:hypothetical protein